MNREHCPRCGMPTNPMPENASHDELLCNECYEKHEAEHGIYINGRRSHLIKKYE